MPPAPQNAEFAHLFELFERLATRRRRAADVGELEDMDDTHTLSIPTDLQPVFRNLATLVTPRTTSGSSTRKGRRNTVAVPSSSDGMDTDSDSDSVAKFPLQGKQYPFKFKMMLHKLYELEDWGRKVREVLERSQKEFKPLSEKEDIREEGKVATKEDNDVGRVHFRGEFGINSPTKRTGRPRSYTVTSPSGNKGNGPQGSMPRVEARDDERAVKKRCVGRRKSMSGMDVDEKAAWVYDAAVASSEINERRTSFDASVPVPTARYGPLQQDGHRRGPARRRVSSLASVASIPAQGKQQMEAKRTKKRRLTSIAVVKGVFR